MPEWTCTFVQQTCDRTGQGRADRIVQMSLEVFLADVVIPNVKNRTSRSWKKGGGESPLLDRCIDPSRNMFDRAFRLLVLFFRIFV